MSVSLAKVESWEDHVEAWHHLSRRVDGAAWDKAALAASVDVKYGEGSIEKFGHDVRCSPKTLWRFVQVHNAFTQNSRRREFLTFAHHIEALTAPDPSTALERAEREGWSVRDLRAHLQLPPQSDGTTEEKKTSSADVACEESGTCGPLTDRDRAFHIAGMVESLNESMRLFEAIKEYDINPVVQKGTKKSLKELRHKIDNIVGWLTALKQAIDGRVK